MLACWVDSSGDSHRHLAPLDLHRPPENPDNSEYSPLHLLRGFFGIIGGVAEQ
jgi:hypothetical protein